MRRLVLTLAFALLVPLGVMLAAPAFALGGDVSATSPDLTTAGVQTVAVAAQEPETWNQVVDDMDAILDEAYATYAAGDSQAAKDKVDVAYFGYYEKLGFEKTVMSTISGSRAAAVEYQFSAVKKQMGAQAPAPEVRESLDMLTSMLREDANRLDGTQDSAPATFIASLLIIVREGFEAILVVGAIIAYLIKSGNADKVRAVYWGALVALGASVLLAILLNTLPGLTGANQEIIEGTTMLLAAAVLIYVSNWMLSKAETKAWTGYIKSKTDSSLSKGSVISLASVAFLAVFREGAETILFYQALLARSAAYAGMIWLGIGVGVILLAIIYLLIRVLSMKVPLKPFFLATSTLLAVMAFSFVGTGVKELQEGNVVGVTPVPGVPSVDFLGIYPTAETLAAQAVVLAFLIATSAIGYRKGRRAREEADRTEPATERA